MAAPKLFYHNYDENEGIETPEPASLEDALKLMEELPDTDGNFLGFNLNDDDEIVQFMYQDDRGLVLDIPNEGHEAIIDLEQCKQIIRDVYAGKRAENIVSETGG